MAAFAIATGIPAEVYAQTYESTPVEISSEKLKVNGQVCYSHIVLEKQTLFSISKAYNVSIDDIYQYNPSVKEKGLQKNSILIIPAVSTAKAAEAVTETAAPKSETAETAAAPEASATEQKVEDEAIE